MDDRLYRSRADRMLSGVAGGLAERLDVDPSVVRVIWVLLVLPSGFLALLAYVVMAIVVPEEPLEAMSASGIAAPTTSASAAQDPIPGTAAADSAAPIDWRAQRRADRLARRAAHRAGSGGGAMVFGIVLVVLGTVFFVRQFIPAIDFDLFWPVALIALGAVLVVGSMRRDRPSA